ncbi:MAG: M23 family metallopeptidase [Candidatus Parcubacteria bacterium]|nr:M23 family metallopeptidase [Candidatus Parcubacteria bacterium]
MKKKLTKKMLFTIIPVIVLVLIFIGTNASAQETRSIFFPTEQSVTFTDSFGDARSGHLHEGIDLMGTKMMPLYSCIDGRVRYVVDPEADYGYAISLEDSDHYTYHYLHVNNDTPGTDDGLGGIANAYAPGIVHGATVTKGQLIGWMGDSGNAENVGPHLHFEIRLPDNTAINPYLSLVNARYPGSYSITDSLNASPDINTDKSLVVGATPATCVSGSRIKLSGSTTVYFCGADAKRYVFPTDKVYYTWFSSFSGVTVVTAEQLANIPLGGNVTYRPGIKMVKIQSDTKVYAVEHGGVLRWIESADTATALYGTYWKNKIDDVSDAFFINYKMGEPVLSAR